MSAIETSTNDSAAETIDEDSRGYTGELLDRGKYIAGRTEELDQLESFGVIRRVKKVRLLTAHTCACQYGSQAIRTSRRVCRHTRIESAPHVDRISSKSQSHRTWV